MIVAHLDPQFQHSREMTNGQHLLHELVMETLL